MEKFNIQVPCLEFNLSMTLYCQEFFLWLTSLSSDWLHGIGWALTLLSLVQIPVWMVVTTVAAAIQGDVMEAFRPSLVWMNSLKLLICLFCLS